MNFNEEEPRKVPKPIPFSQPVVPEVSLILQDVATNRSPTKNPSFSGTEFQTYNAWRWKHVNDVEKSNLGSSSHNKSHKHEFYQINDKFSGSEIERRKNEILYGNPDEPRRPLPLRKTPVIPQCIGASFSDASFGNDSVPQIRSKTSDGRNILRASISQHIESNKQNPHSIEHVKTEMKNVDGNNISQSVSSIGDLYQIIAEQNKQMVLLQKQIQQLLKTQETKEKQIEQLLKSQDTKENKIEQLLKMQDLKEKQIEQLLKAQEKNEKQIEQLIQSQELKEKQKNEMVKQEKGKQEVVSIGLMAKSDTVEKGTNTSFLSCEVSSADQNETKQNKTESSRFSTKDKSLTLNSLELPVVQEHVPTPESSIHVDIPEYNGSSDEDSDISLGGNKYDDTNTKDSKPLGYTFYNNVLTQVNDIIHSHEDKESEINKYEKYVLELEKPYLGKNTCLRKKDLRMVNRPSFQKDRVDKFWGIDFHERASDVVQDGALSNNCTTKRKEKSAGRCTEISDDCHVKNETQSPTDISLKMNALALKYLKQEQISQYDLQPQAQQNCRQADVTIYNVTNLSFGTMRYLERYQISSSDSDHTNGSLTNEDNDGHQFHRQKSKRMLRNGNEYISTTRFS